MEEKLLEIVSTINGYLTDYVLIVLLIGIGLFYTIRTRFVQVRCFPEAMKRAFGGINLKGGKQQGGISAFQALATAIAAQVTLLVPRVLSLSAVPALYSGCG